MALYGRVHGGGGQGKLIAEDTEAVPLGQLRPGLGPKLVFGVGRHHAARVLHGADRPQDQPGDQGALADAVTRGDRDPAGLIHGERPLLYLHQDAYLPEIRPLVF